MHTQSIQRKRKILSKNGHGELHIRNLNLMTKGGPLMQLKRMELLTD